MTVSWQLCESFAAPHSPTWQALVNKIVTAELTVSRWETQSPDLGAAIRLTVDNLEQTSLGRFRGQPQTRSVDGGNLLFVEIRPEASDLSIDALLANPLPTWIASPRTLKTDQYLMVEAGHFELATDDDWMLFCPKQRAADFRQALSRGVRKNPEGPLKGRGDWFQKRHGDRG